MRFFVKAAVATAGAAMAVGGIAVASPASAAARFTVADPYRVPQSSPGVPNLGAIDITATGLQPGKFVFAQLCDGSSPGVSPWNPQADCGPAEAGLKVPATGTVSFPGSDPNFGLTLWHGSNANNKTLGEMAFNCLAPDDNPNGTVTAQGSQPIDPNEPAWGALSGRNTVGGGAAPCQIRITTSTASYTPTDIFDPINLTASGHTTPTGSSSTGPSSNGSGSTGAAGSSGAASNSAGGSTGGGSRGSKTVAGASGSSSDPGYGTSNSGFFGGSLAQTGAEIAGMIIIALGLIATGIFLVRRTRARHLQGS